MPQLLKWLCMLCAEVGKSVVIPPLHEEQMQKLPAHGLSSPPGASAHFESHLEAWTVSDCVTSTDCHPQKPHAQAKVSSIFCHAIGLRLFSASCVSEEQLLLGSHRHAMSPCSFSTISSCITEPMFDWARQQHNATARSSLSSSMFSMVSVPPTALEAQSNTVDRLK